MLWTRSGPAMPWPVGRASLGAWRHPVLTVGTDPVEVDPFADPGAAVLSGVSGAVAVVGMLVVRLIIE
jgi:hypothetical protein